MERHTQQRRAILQVLSQPERHFTAAEIHVEVKKLLPKISLATVYRNLSELVELGMIEPIMGTNPTRYEGVKDGHIHMICDHCGQILDLHLQENPIQHHLIQQYGRLRTYELTLRGTCNSCLQKKRNKKDSA